MSSESKPSLSPTSGKTDSKLNQELVSNVDMAKSNWLLRLFIGMVQKKTEEELKECSEEDCVALLNWLYSEKIDVYQPSWHVTDNNELIPQLLVDENSDNYNLSRWALELCYMWPILLKCKGDIQFVDENGNSILHKFLVSVDLLTHEMLIDPREPNQMVEYLLDKGISVNKADKNGNTPVHLGASNMQIDLVEVMLKNYANINACNKQGDTVLHIIMNKWRYDVKIIEPIKLLIAQGAELNLKNKLGRTPLHSAIKQHMSIVHTLADAGADINAQDEDGATPLHLAVLSAGFDIIQYLIEKGGNVSCREKLFGFTALHMGAFRSSFVSERPIFELLLQNTSNVNDGGNYGITALHLASFQDDSDFVEMLIAHGADVNCRDNMMNSTALHFRARRGIITDYISHISGVEHKPNWKPNLYLNKFYCKSVPALLLRHGLDINAKDICGRTPLHLATEYVKKTSTKNSAGMLSSCASMLLEYGAHVDAQDNKGNTPLHNALKTGHILTLKSLLEFGVDVNESDTSSIVSNCKEDVKNILLLYLVKLKTAELPVSNAYSSVLKAQMDAEHIQSYSSRCLKEVNNMKAFLINDDTSIYNFLHMGWRKRLDFMQKIPADVQNKFPLYGGIVRGCCWEAEQRKQLMEPAKLAWYQITEVHLPDVCLERILDYLKNRYLRVLADGLSNNGE